MKDIRVTARERLRGWCRVCPVCDGRACAGEMPGMGGAGTGEAFTENVRALHAVKLNLRTLHGATTPDCSVDFFGKRLALPVMGAPMAGVAYNLGGVMSEEELADALHGGCADAGSICWSGDGANPALYETGLAAMKKYGNSGIPTIKPRGKKEIIGRIRMAEDAGALAVAIDVDMAGLIAMSAGGAPVGPTDPEDVAAITASTRLPVILKGIMTPDEAVLAASLGVAGIVVSNHGGRVLDSCPGTAAMLPVIAGAVGEGMSVLVDGGVRSGADVLKCLALGADAVLVGRPLIPAAAGGGARGVALALGAFKEGLFSAMLLTGAARASAVPQRVVSLPLPYNSTTIIR